MPMPTPHAYRRWLAVSVALVAAAVALTLRGAGDGGDAAGAPAPTRAAGLNQQLARRVAAILESSTPAQHHQHGHALGEGGRVVCAVEVFGYEPADATFVDEVRFVYAHHLCAVAEPGRAWELAVKASGPLAVELTDPPNVRVPEPGLGYPDRVRALFPEAYRAAALGAFSDLAALQELRRRYDEAA
jgi:hypothetical protein